uniref:Uncharacterized protein n=1 Tax=Alexandrium catenella TaxID=2925 RepID=A0A7S1Q176_ALECA
MAAADVWAAFGGVDAYAAYICQEARLPNAGLALSGGSAWQRLVSEVEIVMKLAMPEKLELMTGSSFASQFGVAWNCESQTFEQAGPKLMFATSFTPLQRRVRYVASRVEWALRQLGANADGCMQAPGGGGGPAWSSAVFQRHKAFFKSSRLAQDLLSKAVDAAAAAAAKTLLQGLEELLWAGCLSPQLLLRPRAQQESFLNELMVGKMASPRAGRCSDSVSGTRQRVREEMFQRGGLVRAEAMVLEKDAAATQLGLTAGLVKSFKLLRCSLSAQAAASSSMSLITFCQRNVAEALDVVALSEAQRRCLEDEHMERQAVVLNLEEHLAKVQRCSAALRAVMALRE